MKFTLAWLKDHLETDVGLERIVATLTAIGLEVDTVEDRAAALAPFRVARVVSAEPHPNADRLRVCVVDTGEGETQVVCGAPNARAGMKGVFAAAGVTLPGTGLELKPAKIRGVESRGMLCSEREMGLSDEHEGIIELAEDAQVGAPVAASMGLDDPVIDVELTPNRPDCTGVRGIARDLVAAGLGTLKPFAAAEPVTGTFDSPIRWVIADEPDNACPYVVGRAFRNLTNGPSPAWAQQRLRAIGLRPISALVDITNYVTIDLGRPLHVFDAAKLAGGDLTMRRGRAGEEMLALNGKTYALDPSMTVIADAEGVHGIGGVMGGEETGCTEVTTEMFLEVALFDPVKIAATGRELNLQSDARYRFERGVDPASADWGAEAAARLVKEFCGGEASHVVRAGVLPDGRPAVPLRRDRVRSLGGVDVPPERQQEILEALGFEVRANGADFRVTPPTWRPDTEGEADLIEEIVRIHGLDNVPAVPLPILTPLPRPALTPEQLRGSQVKRAIAARGLDEAVTWSFTSSRAAELFGGVPDALRLANPISAELDVMRPSILPNLIHAAGRNLARGFLDFAIFEVGPQYVDDTPEGQRTVAAGLRVGRIGVNDWSEPERPADLFDVKADAMAALEAVAAPVDKLQATADAPGWYHPGRSGALRLGPKVLVWFGDLHPRVAAAFEVKTPMAAFELFLDAIPPPKAKGAGRPPLVLSALQPVRRDFAFLLDQGVPSVEVVRAARAADKRLITHVAVFDLYEGKGVEKGKKSLAIAVTLQPTEATLTDEEIEAVAAKVVANVSKQTGGVLRR